jgi:uncharacterized membrane protein
VRSRRSFPARRRVGLALLAGVAVAAAVSVVAAVETAALVGWDAAALVYLVWVWLLIRPMDAVGTARHAQDEDPTRPLADLLLLCAATGSLVAVGFVLVRAGRGSAQLPLVSLGLVSVVLSWWLVHTVFTLRYAALYYRGSGGVGFNQDEPPRYLDFAYLAFTVGMTFQVSDTDIKDGVLRRTVLKHALLSYLFGTGILATTINLVAGLSR